MSGRSVPAILQASSETETDYGGREEAWTAVATVWVTVSIAAPTQALDGAASPPADTDIASAVGRDHPLAAEGQRLLVGDDSDPWRVRRVDRGAPSGGRMTLRLDRLI